MPSGPPTHYLTLAEVAERFRWSLRTLKRMLHKHRISTIGARYLARLTEADVEELVRRMRTPPAQPPRVGMEPPHMSTREFNRRLRMEPLQPKATNKRSRLKSLLDKM